MNLPYEIYYRIILLTIGGVVNGHRERIKKEIYKNQELNVRAGKANATVANGEDYNGKI